MGGRGASNTVWKRQLRGMAKQGKMPTSVMGSREAQAAIFKEIDKLYPMPKVKIHRETDQGDGIHIMLGSKTKRASYPSGTAASEAEKRGVKKWLLWNEQ